MANLAPNTYQGEAYQVNNSFIDLKKKSWTGPRAHRDFDIRYFGHQHNKDIHKGTHI